MHCMRRRKHSLQMLILQLYAEVLFCYRKALVRIIASAYAQKLEETGTEAELRHILYTPLAATYNFAPKHAAAFIGTADPWSDVPAVIRMSEAQDVPMHVYENANHSLGDCGYVAQSENPAGCDGENQSNYIIQKPLLQSGVIGNISTDAIGAFCYGKQNV